MNDFIFQVGNSNKIKIYQIKKHEVSVKDRLVADKVDRLNVEWKQLCANFLPISPLQSIWRYSRPPSFDLPQQGWKIHLSATILSAGQVLTATAPLLSNLQVQFKALSSLSELMKLNAGIFYGYSQIGKFITVYPKTDEEFVFLAKELHLLTRHLRSPAVPFDFRFKKNSNVFYRFGVFRDQHKQPADNMQSTLLISPKEETIADSRNSSAPPEGIKNPLERKKKGLAKTKNPLQTNYKVFRALTQRGKGGVYLAFDTTQDEARLCVIKEGRRNGETNWDGRDGYHRVENEKQVLEDLRRKQIQVPQVYDSFELSGNFYLVTEFAAGSSLRKIISQGQLTFSRVLAYAIQLSRLLSEIHAAGWVWRDCKPENIIVSEQEIITAIDFEGSCPEDCAEVLMWSTPDFTPPETFDKSYQMARTSEDLFSLGKILFLLLESSLPISAANRYSSIKQGKLNPKFKRMINQLMNTNPHKRPAAEQINRTLKEFSG